MLIKDCCTMREGYVNPPQSEFEYFNGEIKWLRANDLNNANIYETSRTLTQLGFNSAGASAILFKPGSIAISKSGTIGRLGILRDYMCGNRAIINIEPDLKKLDTMYLFYWLLSNRKKLERRALGSIQKNLYISLLGSFDIGNLTLEEQKEITRQIDPLFHKVEKNNELIKKLEQYSNLLFHKWFIDFNFPNENGEPYKDNNGVIQDVSGKDIPLGWGSSTVAESCKLVMGQSPPSETYNITGNGLPFYQGVVDFGDKFPAVSKWCSKPTRKAIPGDILLSVRAPVGRLNIAVDECCIGRGVSSISLPNTFNYFAFYEIQRRMNRLIKKGNGTIFDSIKKEDIQRLEFLNPPANIIQKFEDAIHPIQEKIRLANKENNLLTECREILIKKYIL